ncbi:MAG: oxidoreductase [Frankiales bacterium]|nr:oxidoreductase [Frankiales bacterium]
MTTALPDEARGRGAARGRLQGRRLIVLGAGQQTYGQADPPVGHGRAISVLAAREGASVFCVDRDADAAAETAAAIVAEGGTAWASEADASEEADVVRVLDEARMWLGELDGLVRNVGIAQGQGLAGTTVEQWDRVFAVNVRSHFLACRHVLPRMSAGAAIVLVSSQAAFWPVGAWPAYNASKAALSGLLLQVIKEGAALGIRVNAVAPGLMDTALGVHVAGDYPQRATTPVPLGRMGPRGRSLTRWCPCCRRSPATSQPRPCSSTAASRHCAHLPSPESLAVSHVAALTAGRSPL